MAYSPDSSKTELKTRMLNANKLLYKTVAEHPEPLQGKITYGSLPTWINGRLMRNGPGRFEFGETKYDHLFDGMALLHSWTIRDGAATYRSRFLQSETYKKNEAANRIVVSEFGTAAFPDPCKTIFDKFFSIFKAFDMSDMTDNATVSIYPMGENWMAATETDVVSTFDPETLEIKEQYNVSHNVAVNMATAHAMYDSDGTVHNMGNSYRGGGGPTYNILRFDPVAKGEPPLSKGKIVCSIPARWKLNPCYYHSFAMTRNYYVFLEQPLVINVPTLFMAKLLGRALAKALSFLPQELCRFFVVEKASGNILDVVFNAQSFFCFHHINAYEDDDHVVVDLIAYTDDTIMNRLYFEELLKEKSMEDLEETREEGGEVRRFVFPLRTDQASAAAEVGVNLVKLPYTTATARMQPDGTIVCQPEILLPGDNGMELPVINYRNFNGEKYRFCYGLGLRRMIGQPSKNTHLDIVKFDFETKKETIWSRLGCFPSEPIFIPRPGATEEDDGVLLAPVVDLNGVSTNGESSEGEKMTPPFLLVLDARTMAEVARVEFPGVEFHRDIHGIFQNFD